MSQSWILVQVSEDTFSHMADDLKYIGYTTFRGSCSYEVPNEEDFLLCIQVLIVAIYSHYSLLKSIGLF